MKGEQHLTFPANFFIDFACDKPAGKAANDHMIVEHCKQLEVQGDCQAPKSQSYNHRAAATTSSGLIVPFVQHQYNFKHYDVLIN